MPRIASNGYFTFARMPRATPKSAGRHLRGNDLRPSPLAANYDPLVYPDPQRFDIHRKPKRIMSFAVGPHFCVGKHPCRTTITIAIQRLLARFPKARLSDPDCAGLGGGGR